MDWPPTVGELLPRAEDAIGVRYKLATYSLNPGHSVGGPKARGFASILGISMDTLDYLVDAIHAGIMVAGIVAIRESPPHGFGCAVDFSLRGVGEKCDRTATLRTAWLLADPRTPPRLTSAYIKS